MNQAMRVLLDELNDLPTKAGRQPPRSLQAARPPGAATPPTARYVLARWKLCRVNIDYHVEVERHLYSVPYQLVREQVEVRYTTSTLEVFHRGKAWRRTDGDLTDSRPRWPSTCPAPTGRTPSEPRPASSPGQGGAPATGQLPASQRIQRRIHR